MERFRREPDRIRPVVSAADSLALALGGHKAGADWMAPCPVHDDRTPSLAISAGLDGRILVRCHAGCDQGAVVAALRARGVWPAADAPTIPLPTFDRRGPAGAGAEDDRRRAAALALWRTCGPAAGTLVPIYLQSRGIATALPEALRFHPGLKHAQGGRWPGMVALVADGVLGRPVAVHRTFLARDGSGKAPVTPQRMMLGPCRGGAVRLAEPEEVLMVGEGIETCLAAMVATGRPAWAALSTSGLRSLDLPENVREVIVLADGDDAGEAAARDCALRWAREGRDVRIARAPRGRDFNDLLPRHATRTSEEG